jgi:hypothetical protein
MNHILTQNANEENSFFIDFKLKKPKSLIEMQGSLIIANSKPKKSTITPISVRYATFKELCMLVETIDFSDQDFDLLDALGERLYSMKKEQINRIETWKSYSHSSPEYVSNLESILNSIIAHYELFCTKYMNEYHYDFDRYVEYNSKNTNGIVY